MTSTWLRTWLSGAEQHYINYTCTPQPRYSEDIDLVQIKAEPIKDTIVRISEVLSWLGKPVVKQKANNNTLVFRFGIGNAASTSHQVESGNELSGNTLMF